MATPWIQHVKAYQAAHPGMSYREAMSAASPSYNSSVGGKFSFNKAARRTKAAARQSKNSINKAQDVVQKNKHLIKKFDNQFHTNLSKNVNDGLDKVAHYANTANDELNGGKFVLKNALRKTRNTVNKINKKSKQALNVTDKYLLPALEMAGYTINPQLMTAINTAQVINDQVNGGSFKVGGSVGGCANCRVCGGSMLPSSHPSLRPKKPKSFAQMQIEN